MVYTLVKGHAGLFVRVLPYSIGRPDEVPCIVIHSTPIGCQIFYGMVRRQFVLNVSLCYIDMMGSKQKLDIMKSIVSGLAMVPACIESQVLAGFSELNASV